MNRLERFYKIDQLLQERTVVPAPRSCDELEVSLATFKRDLEYMRDRFNAPVVWDADARGYRYETKGKAGPKFELPGLWFTEDEAYALVTMQHLLSSLDQGGLIGPHIAPLMARLDAILGAGEASAGEVRKRIRLLSFGSRKLPLEHFSLVGSALFKRRRLKIEYYARSTNAHSAREVSPQRLVHYRENWYLDTWCHLRNDLRSFSVDGIRRIEVARRAGEGGLAEGAGRLSARQLRHRARRRGAAGEAALLGRARALGGGRGLAPGSEGELRRRGALHPRAAVPRRPRTGAGHPAAWRGGRGAVAGCAAAQGAGVP